MRERQDYLDALLPEDIDLAGAKLAIGSADGDEGLDRVIGDL